MATVSSTVWSSPHLPAQRWRWAGLVVVVSAAISVWVILTAPEGETDLGLRDLAGGCTWLAAGVMVLLWTLPRAGQRKGGLLVALAMASYAIGQWTELWVTAGGGDYPTWYWPDLFWVTYYPLLATAILVFAPGGHGIPKGRVAIEVALVSLGVVSAFALVLDLVGVSEFASSDDAALPGVLPYLAADVVLLGFLAAVVNSRSWTDRGRSYRWLGWSVVSLAVADLAYWVADGADSETVWLISDLAYVVPPLTIGLVALPGARSAQHDLDQGSAPEVTSGRWAWSLPALLPLLAVAAALSVIVVVLMNGSHPIVSLLAVVAVLLVLLRLVVAYRDTASLARSRVDAHSDELTGLPNRRALSRLDDSAGDPATSDHCWSVIIVSLDRFDTIRDSLGHAANDELLVKLAQRLSEIRDPDAVLAALGGERFAFVFDKVPRDRVEGAVADLLVAIDQPVKVGGICLYPSGTAGWSDCGDARGSLREQLRRADVACNAARRDGVGQREYEADYDDAAHRLRLTASLDRALRAGEELQLVHQPIFDLQNLQPVATETLMRWRRPRGDLVMPDEFLPLARAAGFTHRLDMWVLRQALTELVGFHNEGLPLRVSVNVCAESIDASLPGRTAALLTANGVAADRLTLELLEQTSLGEADVTRPVLEALRALGVRLALDDFGTGWSGLTYLRTVDVDVVKIDRSFVADMTTDEAARRIVESVIDLAHSTGCAVVAEGIETAEQLEALQALTCDFGQGYGLARPMSAPALINWMKAAEKAQEAQSKKTEAQEREFQDRESASFVVPRQPYPAASVGIDGTGISDSRSPGR